MKRTGIKDIAKRARVSLASVSRFLNEGENFSIKETTKKRILRAVEELNYVPDHAARSLKSGKKETIGVILSHIDAHMTGLLAEIEICLAQRKHMLLLASSDHDVRREIALVNTMRRRADALLVVSYYDGTTVSAETYRASRSGIPVIYIDSVPAEDGAIAAVTGDNEGDAYRAVRHFIGKGVREYCYVRSKITLPVIQDRFRGFQRALAEHAVPFSKDDVFTIDGSHIAAVMRRIRSRQSAPLFFFESLLPFAEYLHAFADGSIVIGRDVFICGFDEPIIENPSAFFTRFAPVLAEPIPYILQDRKTISHKAVAAALSGAKPAKENVPGIFMNFDIGKNKESV